MYNTRIMDFLCPSVSQFFLLTSKMLVVVQYGFPVAVVVAVMIIVRISILIAETLLILFFIRYRQNIAEDKT